MFKRILISALAWSACVTPALADAETDIQTMLNKLLPIAEGLLVDHGEFFPFGGAMKDDEEVVTISGIDGQNNDTPAAGEVINMLDINLRIGAENNQYHATAVLSNVTVVPPGKSEPTQAIAVILDHREGFSMTLVFPYTMADGAVELGDLFAMSSERKIFLEK
ncbi:MAG: hypothetical protein AB8G18_18060 [Gammaproteobacteria bacterium]